MKLKVHKIDAYSNGIVVFVRKRDTSPWWRGYKPTQSSCERFYRILLKTKFKNHHEYNTFHTYYV